MYKEIYDFAISRGIGSAGNTEKRDVAAYIELDREGNYRVLEARSKDERKQKVLCPKTPKHLAISPVCEKLKYIWPECAGNIQGKTEKIKHEEWLSCMKKGAERSESIAIAYKFLNKIEDSPEMAQELWIKLESFKIKPGEFVSFRIDGKNLENETDWKEWFEEYCDDIIRSGSDEKMPGKKIVSCITGQKVDPIVGKFPKIMAPQTGSGVPVFSNDQSSVTGERCSFHSFGDSGSTACPMSKEETEIIKAGIEYLLTSENNHDNNFGIMYWFDNPDAFNLIKKAISIGDTDFDELMDELEETTERSQGKEEKYTAALQTLIKKGKEIELGKVSGNYYIMSFDVPAKGRLYLSDYHKDTYQNLKASIKKWYKDTTIIDSRSNFEYRITNLYAILLGLLEKKDVKDKFKQAKKELGMDIKNLLNAVISDQEIPVRILHKVSHRVDRDILEGKIIPDIFYLQLIKAYLIRKGDVEMENAMKLNKECNGIYSKGYQCGRWLACMDYIQFLSAQKGVNVSIAKKYYKAMKKSPAKIFTMVNDNKEHYLGKLKSRSMFDKIFGEISNSLNGDIPAHFSIEEQAAFDLGYAQQSMVFMSAKNKNAENKEENENE